MAKEKAANDTLQSEMDKFKAIQDILMGGEMRQIEQRFHKLQERLEEGQSELEKQFVALKKEIAESQTKDKSELTQKIEHLIQQLSEKVDKNQQYTRDEIARLGLEKSGRKELGKLFMMIGESLIQNSED
ncbi:MAG: hypothetical protein AAFQ87_10745 [Bacteroidota bacterium]